MRPNDNEARISLLKSGLLSDLTLIIPELGETARFRIHSSIVASRCRYFWRMLGASGLWKQQQGTPGLCECRLPSSLPDSMDGPWQSHDITLFLQHVYLSEEAWSPYWESLPDILDDIMLRCWLRQHRLASFFDYTEMVAAIEYYLGSLLLDRWAKSHANDLGVEIDENTWISQYVHFLLKASLVYPDERDTLFLRVMAWSLSILPSFGRTNTEKTKARKYWRKLAKETFHVSSRSLAGLAGDSASFIVCSKCLEKPFIAQENIPESPNVARKEEDDDEDVLVQKKKKKKTSPTLVESGGFPPSAVTAAPFALAGTSKHMYPSTLLYMHTTPVTKSQRVSVAYEYLDAQHGLLHQRLNFKSNEFFPTLSLSFADNGVPTPHLHHGRCMSCHECHPVHAVFTRQVLGDDSGVDSAHAA